MQSFRGIGYLIYGMAVAIIMLLLLVIFGCDSPISTENRLKSGPVGIVDTGAYLNHAAFKSAEILDTIDCTGKGIADKHGHGTGTLYRLLQGLKEPRPVIVCKGLRGGSGYSSEIACCFRALADRGVSHITYSGGSKRFNRLTQAGVDYAKAKGVEVIKSAGNTGNKITYPCKGVKLIGSGGPRGISSFSAYKPPRGCNGVYAVAAGYRVKVARVGGGYTTNTGTSFAAPYAAGLLASGPVSFTDLPGSRDGRGIISAANKPCN